MSRMKEKAVTFMPNEIKIPKPPKQPDKPLPAYMRYSRKVWEAVKMQHPEMKMWDIGKLIGEQWRNLPEDERQGFFAEYEVEKLEYQDAMKFYHNSNAYREWLKAKEKAQNALQEQQMMEKMIGANIPKEEPRFQLQQVDDEEEEEDFSAKNVAAARYQRNHRLIAEIFTETSVPNIKSVVTRARLENLKKQVQSLMQHQRKLESEIQDMETKFNEKKRKILENSENFITAMNKVPKYLDIKENSVEKIKPEVQDTPLESDGMKNRLLESSDNFIANMKKLLDPSKPDNINFGNTDDSVADTDSKSLCAQLRLFIKDEQDALVERASKFSNDSISPTSEK
ncbi:SWI/SNF-related matrix-associated actin-dependent regulator of chromatin subfamily E member 1 isoform X2 [Hydra vulgaris]|uniref:SWI/SNF-related matrix-associated actin-dependent regulator of chromatin subfamily E member 1 isoform X2 n=1 Tax=Hydra vulgaris TaxID=6087 RepID=A0ABM4CVL2_HYDVU